jgi:DNA polymerase-4
LERAGSKPCRQDFQRLLEEAVARGARPVRLLGLGVRLLDLTDEDPAQQFELFDALAADNA